MLVHWAVLIGLLMVVEAYHSGYQCPAIRSQDLKLSILSRRNLTGHWIAKVELKHGANQKENETVPWKVDIDHSSENCDGSDSVLIVATLTVPPKEMESELSETQRKTRGDYELLEGLGYYKFHTDIKTWEEAKETCEKEGAYLAVMNSVTEARRLPSIWIHDIFKDWRKDNAYIGIWDPQQSVEFVTIFNETLEEAGYYKWLPDKPDYMGNCGLLRSNSLLGNTYCNERLLFICELKQ